MSRRATIVTVSAACLIVGAALGYYIGERRGHNNAIGEQWMGSMERAQLNGEFEARAYFRCLQDIDSGNISSLHQFALGHVRRYVSNVQENRQQGNTWAPHIPSLYSNAALYVSQHPRKE